MSVLERDVVGDLTEDEKVARLDQIRYGRVVVSKGGIPDMRIVRDYIWDIGGEADLHTRAELKRMINRECGPLPVVVHEERAFLDFLKSNN